MVSRCSRHSGGGVKYVLDSAVEPSAPLHITEWLSRMGKPSAIKVAICASGTYSPRSDCGRPTNGIEKSAMTAQKNYLKLEWKRLENLKRDPVRELGDFSPWQKSMH